MNNSVKVIGASATCLLVGAVVLLSPDSFKTPDALTEPSASIENAQSGRMEIDKTDSAARPGAPRIEISEQRRTEFNTLDNAVRAGEIDPDDQYWSERVTIGQADLAEVPGYLPSHAPSSIHSRVKSGRQTTDQSQQGDATVLLKTEDSSTSDEGAPASSDNIIAASNQSLSYGFNGQTTGAVAVTTKQVTEVVQMQGASDTRPMAGEVAAAPESNRTPREQIADRRGTVRALPEPTTPIATPSSKIQLTTPAANGTTNVTVISVEGNVELERNLDGVTVNGQSVDWRTGSFSTDVELVSGFNIITAVADYGRRKHSATVTMMVDQDRPSMLSAASTNSFAVLVQFSEPMNVSSLDTANFNIVRSDTSAVLPVLAAGFSDSDGTTIALDTGLQSNVEYTLRVVGVKDVAGNPISDQQAEVIQNPSVTQFTGTTPTGTDLQRDTDSDGLTDYVELQGWPVVITRTDGTLETKTVYSDPLLADTDSDLIIDSEERHGGMDPRNPDTDGDTLNDDSEWNRVYSDPTNQDSDGDGIQDGFEYLFFKTSPILADTDGDQIDDPAELIAGNRNPLIADLPSPDISVGNVNLQLNTTFTVTNEEGQTRQESKQNSATLTQAEDQTYSTSNETSTSNTVSNSEQITNSVNVEAEVGFDDGFTANSKVSYGYENQRTTSTGSERGSSQQFGESSSQSAEEQYHESLETSLEKAVTETLTRDIVSSSMKVDLTIDNAGDVPFTISNIELSAQAQDPTNRRRIIPIASLVPENDSLGSVNIGALGDPARGPFVFTTGTDSVFPQEIEELMKNPRGLIVQLANFDIIDQDGNNFAFTSQQVLDRTVGLTFDLGDGRVESYRVATASEHDGNTGEPLGITMAQALEIVGLNRSTTIRDGGNGISESTAGGDDEQIVLPSRPVGSSSPIEPAAIIIKAGLDGVIDATTIVGGDDILVEPDYETALFGESAHIKDGGNGIVETTLNGDDILSSAIVGSQIARGAVIVRDGPDQVISSSLDAGGDDILVPAKPEREVLVRYKDAETTDQDSEIRFWVTFSTKSTDGINFDDLVLRSGEQYDFTFVQDRDRDDVWAREEYLHGSSDDAVDTDSDSLTDYAEINQGWMVQLKGSPQGYRVYPNPTQVDSDRDGLTDDVELACGLDPRQRDTDLDGLTDREEIFGVIIQGNEEAPMVSIDPNEQNDPYAITRYLGAAPIPLPVTGSILPASWVAHMLTPECELAVGSEGFATDPLSSDTDGDFITDKDELAIGLHPNDANDGASFLDDDGDGLPNSFENQPRSIVVNGVTVSNIRTNPNKTDTDDDKLPDLLEFYLGSNPNSSDTDGDGIPDTDEYRNNGDVCIGNPMDNCLKFLFKPVADFNEFVAACDQAPACDVAVIQGNTSAGLGNEQQIGTNLNHRDTDGDGRRDLQERTSRTITINGANQSYTTDPFDSDSDNDNVSDGAEVNTYGTNPTKSNTDDDNAGDFYEIFTDPARNERATDRRVNLTVSDMLMNTNGAAGILRVVIDDNFFVPPVAAPSPSCDYSEFKTDHNASAPLPSGLANCGIVFNRVLSAAGSSVPLYIYPSHDGTPFLGAFKQCAQGAVIQIDLEYSNTNDGSVINTDFAATCDSGVFDFEIEFTVDTDDD